MNRYKATRGDISEEIEAANLSAARRKFLVKNPGLDPELEVIGELPAPVKRRYRVTWGELTAEVLAVHEDDAWSQFCGSNTDTQLYKFPNLHPRIIECLDGEGNAEYGDAGTKKAKADTKSPVEDSNAHDAADSISRMHSVDKLNEIIAADKRATVVAAAKNRLSELGGN